MSFDDRVKYNAGFYALHFLGSLGGKHNPATAITEGGADVWSSPEYGFVESSGYTGPLGSFSWW